MARSTRAARRGIRRGPRRSAHALLALLLTVLTATAVVCGLAETAQASSMTSMSAGPVATTGDVWSASAMGHAGHDGCRQAASAAVASSHEDCAQAHCAQVSGQPHPSCCDTRSPNGVTSTSPAIAPPPALDSALTWPSAVHQPGCPDSADSGPGPPDLHMLQLLRV